MYSFLKAFLVLMKLLSLSQFYAPKLKKWIVKYQILKSKGPRPSFLPSKTDELDQLQTSILWHVCRSHEHQLLQGF